MGYSAEAVVLREWVLMEQHPLRQAQLGALGSVARQGMDLGHMLMGQDEVVPWSIHIPRHLREITATKGLESLPKNTYLNKQDRSIQNTKCT